MKQDWSDLRSFIHGVINLIWPVFAYDLAELASLIIGGYSWATMVPSTIMLILPIVSDVVGIVVAGVRYYAGAVLYPAGDDAIFTGLAGTGDMNWRKIFDFIAAACGHAALRIFYR